MRKTIFAKNRKILNQRLQDNLQNGWKQVSEVEVDGTHYQVKVEKEKIK